MWTLSSKNFFTDTTSSEMSDFFVLPSTASEILLEVDGSGTFSLQVQGFVSLDSKIHANLTGINLESFSSSNTITSNGVYTFSVSGFSKIRLNLTSVSGKINALAKAIG